MQDIISFFGDEFQGNTIQQYLLFLLIISSGLLFKHFISRVSNRLIYLLIRRKAEGVSLLRFQELLHKPFSFILMLFVTYAAFTQLQFPDAWNMKPIDEFGMNMMLYRLFFILLYIGFTWLALRAIDFIGLIFIERISNNGDKPSMQVVSFFIDSIKVLVVILGILIILGSIFHIDVGTLITGLGIGGLAVALAARESLENLFGSFTIFMDKPFVVGDMVKVGETVGVVEKVGFRSTRLRTLDKSYVTLPNKKMIDSELENLTLRTSRRAHFSIGLTYQTSIEQLKSIVNDIQVFIDNHPNTTEDGRVRFKEFGDSSLQIMVMYYVDTMDWTTYLNVRELINYRIMEIVAAHGASFAFPSTSVYIEKHS